MLFTLYRNFGDLTGFLPLSFFFVGPPLPNFAYLLDPLALAYLDPGTTLAVVLLFEIR